MKVRIKENGELRELNFGNVNGDDIMLYWLSAAGARSDGSFEYRLFDELYETTTATYDYWKGYINNHARDQAAICEFFSELDKKYREDQVWLIKNEFAKEIAEHIKADYDAHTHIIQETVHDFYASYLSD